MQYQIRTVLSHENKLSGSSKERGSRFWSAAEVSSPVWFIVECCVEIAGRSEIKRWVTTSVHHAASIERSISPRLWSQIIVCVRTPMSSRGGSVFEVLKEAYQRSDGPGYVYQLGNGMSFQTSQDGSPLNCSEPSELVLVYSRGK